MKVILITGCSTGFGNLAARALAARGDRVYATMRDVDGRNRAAAAELAALPGVRVLEADVTRAASIDAAVAVALAAEGRIDVAVNNAGVMAHGVAEAFTDGQLAEQLDVNVVGGFRLCRAVLPGMRARRDGLIVHMSSVAGRQVLPSFAVYHACKWALEGMAEAMRYELRMVGVDSVIFEPGPFATPLLERLAVPDDVARARAYGDEMAAVAAGVIGAVRGLAVDPNIPNNPRLVIDALLAVIDTPRGQRPVRLTAGFDFDTAKLNIAAAEVQSATLAGAGLGQLAG